MDESDLERLKRASEELGQAGLRFCTRCGAEVAAYQASESLGHDEYWDYHQPIAADVKMERHGDSAYWCASCQVRWYAIGWQDTEGVRVCGHFMPLYVTHCAVCGQKV